MLEWLNEPAGAESPVSPARFLLTLVAAILAGVGVGVSYRLSHGRDDPRPATFSTTLILLSVLIAMVSTVIGSSVARAFSLVGALSIVRFRTVVEDTRDTAFVIFAVIVGMAAGTGQLLVPLLGIPVVGATAVALSYWKRPTPAQTSPVELTLTIRLALGRDPQHLAETLGRHFAKYWIESASTTRQGAALEFVYHGLLLPTTTLPQLLAELHATDGVTSVELERR